jgi:hypothetical protein
MLLIDHTITYPRYPREIGREWNSKIELTTYDTIGLSFPARSKDNGSWTSLNKNERILVSIDDISPEKSAELHKKVIA